MSQIAQLGAADPTMLGVVARTSARIGCHIQGTVTIISRALQA
jgi:hypothetical protein